MCHAAAVNYGGIMAARFFLGVGEACIAPGFALVTGMFYKREEQPARYVSCLPSPRVELFTHGTTGKLRGSLETASPTLSEESSHMVLDISKAQVSLPGSSYSSSSERLHVALDWYYLLSCPTRLRKLSFSGSANERSHCSGPLQIRLVLWIRGSSSGIRPSWLLKIRRPGA